ncbi:MAG TPA: non-ribosomal peptide synthetase, partial [Pseudomonadales bacterium]|nr:non-ribosomal peptide synthetase [Pseudomonadales bacterium]
AFTQLINVDEHQPDEIRSQLALRYVVFGGEALDFAALQTWQKQHALDCPQLINMYGITETTVHVTYYRVTADDLKGRASIIGRPIPDLPVYVLDQNLNPLPVGVPGELHVGGAGLAYGYLNRPELTDERFIENPFKATQPGAQQLDSNLYGRLYKTGDVVRYLANGDLEYLGRIDDQVKIRGFRIELGEIESAICQFEGVREACVLAREDEPGNKRLVAYIATGEAEADADTQSRFIQELRQHLKTQLPEYMVPAAFVLMEALPLTGNGKIDKRALPVPDQSALVSNEYVAPRNETEQTLVQIWQEVLKLDRVGVRDNFFEIGGQSLLATQIITRVRDVFDVDIALARIFEDPTVEALAMHIVEATLQNSLGDDDDLAALLAQIENE